MRPYLAGLLAVAAFAVICGGCSGQGNPAANAKAGPSDASSLTTPVPTKPIPPGNAPTQTGQRGIPGLTSDSAPR